MAKAKFKDEPKHIITLKLTLSEAKALRAVFSLVGGCPDTSGRGQIDGISEALDSLGKGLDYAGHVNYDMTGSISFNN